MIDIAKRLLIASERSREKPLNLTTIEKAVLREAAEELESQQTKLSSGQAVIDRYFAGEMDTAYDAMMAMREALSDE